MVAYDTKRMRPACVNISAALGADPRAPRMFDPKDWLTELTPDMGVYEATDAQMERLVAMTEKGPR